VNLPNTKTLALIRYRMQSVAIGHLAIRHLRQWSEVPTVRIYFNDLQVIEGKATAFTNGAIEAAVLHSRALLEFLGLGERTLTTLRVRDSRRKDDIGIEQFGTGTKILTKVSIAEAVRPYKGPAEEAESALAYVAHLANKGIAHMTANFEAHDPGINLLEIAFRGIPTLVVNNFYSPLGIPAPDFELSSRPRVAT
jgi:hypothetical protein